MNQIWSLMCKMCAQHRTPGAPDDNDFFLFEMLAQELRDFDAVGNHALNRETRCNRAAVLAKRPTSAALIPLNHGEVLLPPCKHGVSKRAPGVTGSTVKDQDDWI